MPQVSSNPPAGPITFNYNISTPSCPSAKSIDPSLPTLLMLHPIYMEHHIWHPQLADPQLRRFNIVVLDSRGHGRTGGDVPTDYRRPEAGEDVYHFMEALKLPPVHLVGLSMGACVALQVAVTHPEKVLSLTMVAPLPLNEPAEVLEGRQEIYDCWEAAVSDPEKVDEDALLHTAYGAVELGCNGQKSKLIDVMLQIIIPFGLRNWRHDKIEQLHTLSVKFFSDRKPHSTKLLQRIQCPITLVHCGADIAYPIELAEEIRDRMEEAGLTVNLVDVPGAPHFGTLSHYFDINPIIHDFVAQQTKTPVPPALPSVVSPFEDEFAAAGCPNLGVGLDDSDSDEEFF
ncbi:hypothetical protein CC1G_02545 [Coprinopsis cinerea okayama7|uniref:AB hydrolase-1 domain-containing protein n=1 Tax=Coprinopsis cinerea (strain Okayama-7 / 130 / ATCC MYA-4618 / FGSC 9003) TaxID=240176 RepID=A8NBT5_COPC7|nr:hypothetical protein CC1G_02545 [Coprinopsis cinerea okayama7\|eukprot:XP_001832283.1 hypothetical protein CC1G_02545 [Coprinopsis cinerea okayama7\